MKLQRSVVEKIEADTDEEIAQLPDWPRPSRLMVLLRLYLLPPCYFIGAYLLGGLIFRGRTGFVEAVNRWAYAFTLEAKRYERYFGDDTELTKKYRDFL